jgi:hypothetical protein
MTELDKAYIAGFIDADGCINAQIVRRDDYQLKFQIRVSITFFQSTKRHWFLLQMQKCIKHGAVLRKRNDGISELSIVGATNVSSALRGVLPFLRIKKKQAELVLQIVSKLRKHQAKQDFLGLCDLADQVGLLNDSRKRTVTAAVVREVLLFPVETSVIHHSEDRDISSG